MTARREISSQESPHQEAPAEDKPRQNSDPPAETNTDPQLEAIEGGEDKGKMDANAFEALLDYLKRNRGADFTGYKRQSLMRRVTKRMQMVSILSFSDYLDYLEVHPEEFNHLFNTVLINVTSFFRDKEAWDHLAKVIVPEILAAKKESDNIRIWSAGCASGEEAYSIAMIMLDALGSDAFKNRVKIFATDIDEGALAQARLATYSAKDMESVPLSQRDKYFTISGGTYVFRPDLRRSIIFGRHDLVQDAPISHLDLLVCRNTLMYFNSETQSKVLARFHFGLNDAGFIFLGRAELLLTHAHLFSPVSLKYRIFRKLVKANMREKLLVLAQAGDYEASNHLTRQVRLREVSFDGAPAAQMVVDLNGNLILANEKARILLSLRSRDIGKPLQDLEVSYRPVELRSLIEQAYAEHKAVVAKKAERRFPDGSVQYLDVQVTPLVDNGGGVIGVTISFNDVTDYYQLREELERSKHDLETAYEELQSTNEELETTNEELQSTVEELETTNEELQSSNEELETTNEELQSTNEELETMNEELRQRTEELNSVNSFHDSVFNGMGDGIAVLGTNGKILIWNRAAEDMWGMRSDEVIGMSFSQLDIGLPVEKLRKQISETLKDCSSSEAVLDATNRKGKSVSIRVRITPIPAEEKGACGAILFMGNHESCQ